MKKVTKTIVASSLALGLVSAPFIAQYKDVAKAAEVKAPSKNLIVIIGDGMGPAQVTAARYYSKKKFFGQGPSGRV